MRRSNKIQNQRGQIILMCCGLALLTLIVYWPVLNAGFLNYDDDRYVTANSHVLAGLTLDGFVWAFQGSHAGFWHPLTWLSHMLDCQIFGTDPRGHHLTALIFHIANTLLLFLILKRMTGAMWRSGLIGALFALHPLHVEPVAWISARKDVLSTFFGMLVLLSYARYAALVEVRDGRAKIYYGLSLIFFIFGLMSKPMLVTVPFVLLSLDFWPLKRVLGEWQPSEKFPRGSRFRFQTSRLTSLFVEKLPFFVLAAVASFVTFWAQRTGETLATANGIPFVARMGNALVSYFLYLRKMFWPGDLTIAYLDSNSWPAWEIVLISLALLGISLWAIKSARQRPYLLVGWFWYLGTLVPVIGLVQIGSSVRADRYTYIPLIGIFIIVAWSLAELALRWPRRRWAFSLAGVLLVVACAVGTEYQLPFWKNSETLFRHTLKIEPGNYLAYNNLGAALQAQGKIDEAIHCFSEALNIKPGHAESLINLGQISIKEGKYAEASSYFESALKSKPNDAETHNNLATLLDSIGRRDEAISHYRAALQLQPDLIKASYNLADTLASSGKFGEAIEQYLAVLRRKPDFAEAHYNLAILLAKQNQMSAAVEHYLSAIQVRPEYEAAHFNLASLLEKQGKLDDAATHFSATLKLKPDSSESHYRLAKVLQKQGKLAAALEQYREAVRLKPDSIPALNDLAWLLATSSDSTVRDGSEALRLASHAVKIVSPPQPSVVETLAAALAATGHFSEAAETQQTAIALAKDAKKDSVSPEMENRLRLYQRGEPYLTR